MHIIHIIESTATGTLSMVEMLANHQVNSHRVSVIFSVRPDTPKAFSELFDARVELTYINMSGLNGLKAVLRIRQHIKTVPDAVVHCHSSVAGFLGRFAVWRLPNLCFYSPHCIAFMRQDISRTMRFMFVFLEKLALFSRNHYIACSGSEANIIRQYLPNAQVDMVENAVDFAVFPSVKNVNDNQCDNEPQPIHVITVGGIRAQKDPYSFAKIAMACPYPNVHFTWVGDGDEAAKSALLAAGVKVTGWCSRSGVMMQVCQADIYLSTALWEGLPVALIEAQSVGAILLVNNCPGNSDVVEHEKTGLIFSSTTQANTFLHNIISDINSARVMASQGPELARARFGVARYCKAILAIYQQNTG